jgi:hypothetical protein
MSKPSKEAIAREAWLRLADAHTPQEEEAVILSAIEKATEELYGMLAERDRIIAAKDKLLQSRAAQPQRHDLSVTSKECPYCQSFARAAHNATLK